MENNHNKFNRVMIKVSGESLMGNKPFGHDVEAIKKYCTQIAEIQKSGTQVCIVVGGGNIFRGVSQSAKGMDRTTADYMGMLATCMNAMALQNILEGLGIQTRMQSAVPMDTICEQYIRRRAMRHLEKNRVIIFAGGTGNPYFTTDTASVLRAAEMKCDVILKGTQVDGVYSDDPRTNPDATRYDEVSYDEVVTKRLKVMDGTAFTLARDNNLPIMVFSIHSDTALIDAVNKKGKYTLIR